jgi:hypothetical protein
VIDEHVDVGVGGSVGGSVVPAHRIAAAVFDLYAPVRCRIATGVGTGAPVAVRAVGVSVTAASQEALRIARRRQGSERHDGENAHL